MWPGGFAWMSVSLWCRWHWLWGSHVLVVSYTRTMWASGPPVCSWCVAMIVYFNTMYIDSGCDVLVSYISRINTLRKLHDGCLASRSILWLHRSLPFTTYAQPYMKSLMKTTQNVTEQNIARSKLSFRHLFCSGQTPHSLSHSGIRLHVACCVMHN